jgi:hypothetical protein
MLCSNRELIDLVAPRIPGECFGDTVMPNIRALSEQLPDIFSSYYLECRLAAEQKQVDFLACLAASRSAKQMKRISAAVAQPPQAFSHEPGWRFVWNVIHRWASATDEWYRRIPFLWLEFDHMNTRPAARQVPSLCVCLDPDYPDASPSSAPWNHQESYDNCLDFLMPAVPPAFESLFSANNRRTMAACFKHLPPGGRIIHVSFMLARAPATIKLYGAIPKDLLVDYLKDIEWPGPFDSLRHVAHTFCTPETADDTVYFDLSLDSALLPYAAIAFSQLQLVRPTSSDPRRRALLGLLEEHGLCAPEKREAIQTWPGGARESNPSTSSTARAHRWLDTKIALHVDQGISAKGYIGFSPVLSVF